LIANKNAITLTERRNEYDIVMNDFDMNMNWNEIAKNFQPLGLHLANEADITLPRVHYAASARSSSVSRESEYGTQRGRAGTAEPFEDRMDLGLDMGDDSGDITLEYGRDAAVSERAPSVMSGMRFGGRASSVLSDRTVRSASAGPGSSVLGAGAEERLAANQDVLNDLDAPGDLGLDFGDDFVMPPADAQGEDEDAPKADDAPRADDVPMAEHTSMDVDEPEAAGQEGVQAPTEEEVERLARARRECE
jgi:hypothetical protein